jgi:hypothetical protein
MNPENPPTPDSNSQYSDDANPSPVVTPQSSGQIITPTTNPMPPVTTPYNPQIVVSNHGPAVNPVNIVNAVQPESSFSRKRLVFVLLLVLIVSGGSIAGGLSLIGKSQKPFQAASSSGNSAPSGWTSFSNQDGNFNAMFPNTPQAIPQSAQPAGQGTVIFKGYQSGNENMAYAVVYGTFSSNLTLSSDTQGMLVNYVNSLESGLQNVQVVSTNNTTVSGQTAETYEFTGTKSGKNLDLTGEVVLDNHVLYNVFTTQINSQAPNSQYFLNNFKIGQ